MDNYLHSKTRFLTETERAEMFTAYLRGTKKKDQLRASGSMKLSHEVCRWPDGQERLCETIQFDSLGAFLYADLFRGIERNYIPCRCQVCGKYFLHRAGKYSSYCEQPSPNDPNKTCREVGSRKRYDEKCKTDPVWLVYNRAYKAHYARYLKKKMTTAQFEQWSRYAVELRNQAEQDALEFEEYRRLMKI